MKNNRTDTQSTQLEGHEMTDKAKNLISSTFDIMKENLKVCDLSGMTHNSIRITDMARALKEQNKISSNDYLDIINKLDDIVSNSTRDCKCMKR